MDTMRMIFAVSALAVGLGGGLAMADPWKGFAASNDTAANEFGNPLTDETGLPIFGFDIGFAGNTPASVKHFVAGLNSTQKRSVTLGCNQVLRDPDMAGNTTVFAFCRNLHS